MSKRPGIRCLYTAAKVLVVFALFISSARPVIATPQDERRVMVGLKLFPALVAADQDLPAKVSSDGSLRLLLIYNENRAAALRLARRLAELQSVGGMRFRVDTATMGELSGYRGKPIGGVFITEWMPDAIAQITHFCIESHTVVFSPFRGDVRAGILGGLHISDQILPLVNMRTLRASGIRIKPFFLEVAKQYE